MPPTRTLSLRIAARGQASRLSHQTPVARSWRHACRRGYASAGETAKQSAQKASETAKGGAQKAGEAAQKVKGSELPWILGAVGVTAGGTWLVLDPSKLGPIYNHEMPGQNYHGGEHGEEHEEGEEDGEGGEKQESEEGGEEQPSGEGGSDSESSSDGGDSQQTTSESSDSSGGDTSDSSASEDSPSNEKTQAGRNKPGEQGVGVGKLEEATELPPGPDGQRRFLQPSSKGGNMRRVESAKGVVLGRAEGQEEGESVGDVKDGSTSAVAGKTSKQQKGISNTDTKHSIDIMADPEKSKKGEGVPDTAKIQGTVDPSRKAT